MTEQDVLDAFLDEAAAEASSIRSDGARLYVGEELVAEWHPLDLIIVPRPQGAAQESCKERLTHAVLLRMCRDQQIRRLLRSGCRDLWRAALGRRPGVSVRERVKPVPFA